MIIGIGAFIGLLLMSKKSRGNMAKNKYIYDLTDDMEVRGCDPKGCGHYGASRGSRKHSGIDLVIQKGEPVYSPITGYVSRYPYPYASDLKYKGIEIIGEGEHKDLKVKIFYCVPVAQRNAKVVKGQKVAVAQAINEKYGKAMTNHIHVEFYKNNVRVDPTPYLNQ